MIIRRRWQAKNSFGHWKAAKAIVNFSLHSLNLKRLYFLVVVSSEEQQDPPLHISRRMNLGLIWHDTLVKQTI